MAVLNSCFSTYASAMHFGISRNKHDMLPKEVFLKSLFARASHFTLWDCLVLYVRGGLLVFQDVSCRPPGGDWLTVLYPFRHQHPTWRRSQLKFQKSISDCWPEESVYQVRMCTSLCWKNMLLMLCTMHYYSTVAPGALCCSIITSAS